MADDPQAVWRDYYSRKRSQRRREAAVVWQTLTSSGVAEDTALSVDFVHFGRDLVGIESLASQLSENYAVTVTAGDQGYWLATSTTRPYGVCLTADQHLAWVDFMCDVGQSYGCVFSTWSIEASSIGVHARSECAESDS